MVDETDIRLLVMLPPTIGFGGILVIGLLIILITGERLQYPLNYFLVGGALLITAFSGFAQIYKKEMPGTFGKIIKGKTAIISGIIGLVISSILGLAIIIMAAIGKK